MAVAPTQGEAVPPVSHQSPTAGHGCVTSAWEARRGHGTRRNGLFFEGRDCHWTPTWMPLDTSHSQMSLFLTDRSPAPCSQPPVPALLGAGTHPPPNKQSILSERLERGSAANSCLTRETWAARLTVPQGAHRSAPWRQGRQDWHLPCSGVRNT